MPIDQEVIDSVKNDEGNILTFALLDALRKLKPEEPLQYIEEILRTDPGISSSEERVKMSAIDMLEIYQGKKKHIYCTDPYKRAYGDKWHEKMFEDMESN
ncbi:MAG: hypothetical protein UY04_C0012G0015 [Parcubacteria group bacterium GW2011_GWA2_47_7]|nr:MAG: hypothetical protein UY04_C0012G0015 [Parcubacteria group bacterium GW2011_GWA2_47_7]